MGDGVIDPSEACDDGNTDTRAWCTPDCSAVSGPQQLLYVAVEDRTVYVVDLATQSILTSIPEATSSHTYYGNIKSTPDGRFILSTDLDHDDGPRLNIVNTSTNTIDTVIDLSPDPISGYVTERLIEISPDSRHAYLTDGSTIFELGLDTLQLERALSIDSGSCRLSSFGDIIVSPDGRYLYGTDDHEYMFILDLLDGSVTCDNVAINNPACYEVFSWFASLELSIEGRNLFRSLGGYEWLLRIDTKTGKHRLLCADLLDDAPIADAIQMSCDGKQLHVLAPNWATILTVDPVTMESVRRGDLGSVLQDEGSRTVITRDGATLLWSYYNNLYWMDVVTSVVGKKSMPSGIGGLALVTVPTRTGDLCQATARSCCESGFESSSLLVKEVTPGQEKLVAKFAKGPSLNQMEFGNPMRPPCGSTEYALCIYDEGGVLAGSLEIDRAGHACEVGVMCWESISKEPPYGKGYAYRDSHAGADGVSKLRLRSGTTGKSKILLKAKNDSANGSNSLPTGIAAALAGSGAATVQLVTNDAQCFSTHLGRVKRADSSVFKAAR